MNLTELKTRSPAELLAFAEELEVENCNSMRKQDMMFAILKQLAEQNVPISGVGVLEVLHVRATTKVAGSTDARIVAVLYNLSLSITKLK
mgnify:CR=1 FL=1